MALAAGGVHEASGLCAENSQWLVVEEDFCLLSDLHRYIPGGGFVQVQTKYRKVYLKRGQPLSLVGHESYSNHEENMEVIIKSANVLLSTTLQVNFVRIILPHVYTGSYHKFWGKYFRFNWDFWVSCPKSDIICHASLGGSHSIRDRKIIS